MSPDSAATPLKSTAPGFTPVAWLRVLAGPLIGIAVGLLIGAVLIRLAGAEVGTAYTAMLRGAFGGQRQLTETALKAAPLLLVGLGLTVAFRARVWNIGGEGQYFMGALFGSVAALTLSTWPAVLLIPIMLLLGAIGGGGWGLGGGLFQG